jgi:hypothetical protein
MKKTFLTFRYKTKQKDRKRNSAKKQGGRRRERYRETGAKERVFSKFEKAG